jgi:hypothetical protein
MHEGGFKSAAGSQKLKVACNVCMALLNGEL